VDETLEPLAWLIGTWRGTAEGHPVRGTQERRYEGVLRGQFLMGTNRTTWLPSDQQQQGEVHEDISLISFDRAAGRFVMHVFYVERFVAEYLCGPQATPDAWVFTADRVQNGPSGMRSRETLVRRGEILESRFELAMAGKEFSLYTRETLARV
jgi:hypothetical protein